MDFLGLRTLTVIQETRRLVQEKRGQAQERAAMPLDDKATYELLAQATPSAYFNWKAPV